MNYPNLYEAQAIHKGYIPDHDGIGTLSDAESCIATVATDGTFELDMIYPASGKYADRLFPESLLRVNLDRLSHNGNYRQFFRITSAEYTMASKAEIIKTHAEHLSYDLKWHWCKPVQLQTKRLSMCIEHIRNGGLGVIDPFVYQADTIPTLGSYVDFWHDELFTKREGLFEIAALFGLHVVPDNLTISLKSGGTETGVILEKGKNLAELTITKDPTQGVTGVYVYYQDSDRYVAPLLVAPYKGAYGVPHYTSFNYAGKHQEGEFDSPVDEGIVKQIGEAYLRNHTQPDPVISYSAKIADIGQNFALHDIVTVAHKGFEVNEKLPVQKITFDVLRNRFMEIEVGNFVTSFASMIADLSINAKG